MKQFILKITGTLNLHILGKMFPDDINAKIAVGAINDQHSESMRQCTIVIDNPYSYSSDSNQAAVNIIYPEGNNTTVEVSNYKIIDSAPFKISFDIKSGHDRGQYIIVKEGSVWYGFFNHGSKAVYALQGTIVEHNK